MVFDFISLISGSDSIQNYFGYKVTMQDITQNNTTNNTNITSNSTNTTGNNTNNKSFTCIIVVMKRTLNCMNSMKAAYSRRCRST